MSFNLGPGQSRDHLSRLNCQEKKNILHINEQLEAKAWFKRRILHAPNQILILVDSN